MHPSILVVGIRAFCDRLRQQVSALANVTLYQAENAAIAQNILDNHVPDVIILQASQPANWAFCETLRQNHTLLSIYCILLDDQDAPPGLSPTQGLQRYTQQLARATSLGVDTYLWIPTLQTLPAPATEPQLASGGELSVEPKVESQVESGMQPRGEATPQEVTPGEATLQRILEAHISQGLRRVQVYQELSQANDLLSAIALVDALTQLANRRAFDWELPRQVEIARRHSQSLSLLLLDIDYFKGINDRHGHLVGDQVLQMVSERLRHNMRFHETPFRYGGEEFVVLLQATDLIEGGRAGERLRRLIQDTSFVVNESLDLTLTVSAGVATLLPSDDSKGKQLLNRADQRLLKAKQAGRNRVVVS